MPPAVRLADLLAGLSIASDLGFGLPPETAMRSCLAATQLAHACSLPEPEVRDSFFALTPEAVHELLPLPGQLPRHRRQVVGEGAHLCVVLRQLGREQLEVQVRRPAAVLGLVAEVSDDVAAPYGVAG